MLNAKKRFIDEMKTETERFMHGLSAAVPGFSKGCASALMALYPAIADKAVQQMTLIACEKYPESYCLFVISNSCSAFLLDEKNDSILISGNALSSEGKAIMGLYRLALDRIASDPKSPAGQHNTMQLNFVEKQLAARMK